ncbi:MAG TPA: ATP-binding protein [Terriglobia bacterium]|nr:ATP-binding protein [Terriglobia bacterium]
MSFRAKLMAVFAVTVIVSVGLVAWIVSASTRNAFERLDRDRTAALVAQFQRDFGRRADEVTQRVEGIATAGETLAMAVALGRASPDYSAFVNEAGGLATAHQLDFLELTTGDGTIVSSAQWPARFGYKETWTTEPVDWSNQSAFLKREELPEGEVLAVMAVRVVRAGEKKFFVVGGLRLDKLFLASLVLPAGTRALLYQSAGKGAGAGAGSLVDVSGPVAQAEKLATLITQRPNGAGENSAIITWTDDPESAETFHVIPLKGRNQEILGMFLVGSSRRELVELESQIRWISIMVGMAGILFGIVLSGWMAGRVTRPVRLLADASRQVADGNWEVRVEVESEDEMGQLARAFNRMTQQLVEQRGRLLQAERVAAWRELARRLAHELKNPLFPLQITVENLLRSRESNPAQFDEVFRESTSTLLAELANLRIIVGRFSDFAKMPAPQLRTVDINEVVRGALKLMQAQIEAPGKPPVALKVDLASGLGSIQADPELLHRAVGNLILNALDAMPSGGTLAARTQPVEGGIRLQISDSGKGLTKEECERLFTPYYTTKQHGTGLGLAIVQSVVSDHGGKISVKSEPDQGTMFTIDLPALPPASSGALDSAMSMGAHSQGKGGTL